METCWLVLKIQTCAIILLFSILGFNIQGSDGLKDVHVDTKPHVRRGEELKLTCQYDAQGEPLYVVKWYRNSKEFYRFIPKEEPKHKVFVLPGIEVDVMQSNENVVILKNVSFETNGKYKCAVSVEGSFQTLEDTKELTVVAIGYDGPKLSVDKVDYNPGDSGRGNCTVEKTFPAANITWFINDVEVSKEKQEISYLTDQSDPTLTTTISLVTFPVPNAFSPVTLKCMGQMYDVYQQSSVFRIQSRPAAKPSVGGPDTLRHADSNASSASSTLGRGSTQAVHSNLITFLHLLSAQLVIYAIVHFPMNSL